MELNVFMCVWQSVRVGGGGHDDNSSETPARKEQGVCIMDKLGSVCLGHDLVFVSQPGSWLRLSIIQFSLLQFHQIPTLIECLLCASYCPGCQRESKEQDQDAAFKEFFSARGMEVQRDWGCSRGVNKCWEEMGPRRQSSESSGGSEKAL